MECTFGAVLAARATSAVLEHSRGTRAALRSVTSVDFVVTRGTWTADAVCGRGRRLALVLARRACCHGRANAILVRTLRARLPLRACANRMVCALAIVVDAGGLALPLRAGARRVIFALAVIMRACVNDLPLRAPAGRMRCASAVNLVSRSLRLELSITANRV